MQSPEELQAVMKLSDEEVTRRALEDPDAQPLTDAELRSMVCLSEIPGNTIIERLQNVKRRTPKRSLTLHYDADIVAYYQAKGEGYQQAMNDALRMCMQAEQRG